MNDYQLHYLLNEGMQRNVQHHIKQRMRKSIWKSRWLPYSRPEHHVRCVKRPSNPFNIWFQSERSKIPKCSQEQNRNITNQLEARWKSMSKEEKAPFYYEARKVKRLHKKAYPSYQFKPMQKMKTIHSKETHSKIVEKPKENRVEIKTSNGRKEEVCSGHMPAKSSNGIDKKKASKEDVMNRCMAELKQLMNSPPDTKSEVCEKLKLRKDEVLRRVRDELIGKISAEQTPQYPSFMYPGYPSHTPYNSPCFPSPGYSYSLPAFYGSSHAATLGYWFSIDQNEQYMHHNYSPSFFQEASQFEDSQFFNSYHH